MGDRHLQSGAGSFLSVEVPKVAEKMGLVNDLILITDIAVMFMKNVVEYLQQVKFDDLAVPRKSTNEINYAVVLSRGRVIKEKNHKFHEYIAKNLVELVNEGYGEGAYRKYFAGQWQYLEETVGWKSYWGINPQAQIVHFHGIRPNNVGIRIEQLKLGKLPGNLIDLVNYDYFKYGEIWQKLDIECKVVGSEAQENRNIGLLQGEETKMGNWSEYARLAKEKAEAGETEEAIALYEQAISLEPEEAWPYIKLANLVEREKQLGLYEKAIFVEENNPWGYIGMVKLLKEEGDFEAALEKCVAGLRVQPGNKQYPNVSYGEDQLWADLIIKAGYSKVYSKAALVYHSHDYNYEETFKRSKTEAEFFLACFGYKMVESRKQLEIDLAFTNKRDVEYGKSKGLSELEIANQLTLNRAKFEGWIAIS